MPNPRSTVQIAAPIHPMPVPFPTAYFVLALVSDVAFLENLERLSGQPHYGCWVSV
jgi:uncharacterized membrane protein